MKVLVLPIVCAMSSAAVAADFRTMDYGQSCQNVRILEEQLGSTFLSADPEGLLFMFNGFYLNRPVEIAYWCNGGQFQRGSYVFVLPSSREATELYEEVKDLYGIEFGEPYYDFDSQKHRDRMQSMGIKVPGTKEYSCIWENNRRSIQINAYGPRDGRNWKMAISYEIRKEI